KKLYKLRSQTIERSFADAKELHSFRYARRRGRKSVQEQAYLTAAVQTIKKMTLLLSRRV
ncbi:MAG: transposase, partial [Planococcus sp. (in: firmicutes)]